MKRLLGVLGDPISHSLSPRIHQRWLDDYSIDAAYLPFNVPAVQLEHAVHGLTALGAVGCNITVPHKPAALVLCNEISDAAAEVGAVNTLSFHKNSIKGDNTDIAGFAWALQQQPVDLSKVVLMGAGGAAAAVVKALADLGCQQLKIVNRTLSKAEQLTKLLPGATAHDIQEAKFLLTDASLFINATALTMNNSDGIVQLCGNVSRETLVVDLYYSKDGTALTRGLAARGNPVMDGLPMLLAQAAYAFNIWFGLMPSISLDEVDALRQAL